jgi:hypothetical protein
MKSDSFYEEFLEWVWFHIPQHFFWFLRMSLIPYTRTFFLNSSEWVWFHIPQHLFRIRILKKCWGIWNQTHSKNSKEMFGYMESDSFWRFQKKCWGIWNQTHSKNSKEMLGYMESDSFWRILKKCIPYTPTFLLNT